MSAIVLESDLRVVESASDTAKPQANELEFVCLDSFEAALPLRSDWDALVECVGGDVFNTFDWCATWWKHFGHRRALAIYVARRGDKLVAVWPLFREKIWWGPIALRVVRVVGCDHGVTTCNLITAFDSVGSVASTVIAALEQEGPWDVLHIGEIPGYAQNGSALAEGFRKSLLVGAVVLEDDAYPHAVFDVPADYEAYLAGLSVKERRNVRRDERELARQGGGYREPTEEQDVDAAFDALINLHRRHWAARGRHGHFDDVPGVEAFHREVARKCLSGGRLALVEVQTPNGVIASEYALRFNRRLHWIIGGRREDVTSRVGFCGLVRGAVREGVTLIDGLPGAYDYKRRLGAKSLSVKMISVLPRGGRGAARRVLTRAVVQGASLVYHRAWFWHLAPWLMKRMPHLASFLVRPGLWERFARSRFLVVARHRSEEKAELHRESE